MHFVVYKVNVLVENREKHTENATQKSFPYVKIGI